MLRKFKYLHILLASAVVSLFFSACFFNGKNKAPDVSDVKIDFRLQRFERDLFALDTNNLESNLDQLSTRYPDFLPFFAEQIAHDPSDPNETPLDAMRGFVTAPQLRRLNDSVQTAFPDLRKVESDLSDMFRYYKYYFPKRPTPRVITAVTEFVGDAYMVNDTLMMIGLDFFLGPNFSGYNPDDFPFYMRRGFQPDYLSTKAAKALAVELTGPPAGSLILDNMINNGKALYIMSKLLPQVPDSMLMGYTHAQMEGCYANEQNVWARLLEMKVLYEPVNRKNEKIVSPSPDAGMVFREAPGEIGNWLGWQIVNAYMERHPNSSLDEMIQLRDSQKFLEAARYKPRR